MSDQATLRHVAVLAPLPLELDAVIAAFDLESSTADPTRWIGRCGGSTVSARRIGMGPAVARTATELLFDSGHGGGTIDHVMVVGICGGLDPALEIGTVLVPDSVIDQASGAAYPHFPPGDPARSGSLMTTEEVTFDPDLSRRLAAEGVLGLDMETSAVAAVCEHRGCRWSVYRAISDRFIDGLLDPRVVALTGSDGEIDLDALTRLVDDDPELIPKLERLADDSVLAARRAAEAAVHACLALGATGDS